MAASSSKGLIASLSDIRISGFQRTLLIAAGLALLIFVLPLLHILNFHEADAFDMRLRLSGSEPAHEDIVIVEIDDTSIRRMGQWPWPRSVHGALLNNLNVLNPRFIFFDVLFTDPGASEEDDLTFARALKGSKTLLPFFYAKLKPFQATFPYAMFLENAMAVGFVNVDPDKDGIIRRFQSTITTPKGPAFHPAIVERLFHYKDSSDKANQWLESVPQNSKNEILIHYPGNATAFQRIPFWKLMEASTEDELQALRKQIEGKVVLVGHTATGTTDLRSTPWTPLEAGVYIQASAFHTVLSNKYFRVIPWWLDFILLMLMSLGIATLTFKLSPRRSVLVVLGVCFGFVVLNLGAFVFLRWVIPLFKPLAAFVTIHGVTLFSRFMELRMQHELTSRELKTAARIQESFLPQGTPKSEKLDVDFYCRFIKPVGGDLYDWADLGPDQWALCVGDVSGKGIPAALYMTTAVSEFRREVRVDLSPHEVMQLLNDQLSKRGQSGMFLTLLYLIVNEETGRVQLSSAGHDPMIHYHGATGQAEIIEKAQGTPLGLFAGMEYESAEIQGQPGDLLIVITDGIKELRGPHGEELGMERLSEMVKEAVGKKMSSTKTIQYLFEKFDEYQATMSPHDDRTMLCIRFL